MCKLRGDQATIADQLELAVVIPTYKEVENVQEMVHRLNSSLGSIRFEIIFVDDDSPDGTAARVREIGLRYPHVRCIQRIGRRGLSSACIDGMMATAAPFVAVIDGDLQHDERLLPDMLRKLRAGHLDVVVGSRYINGGGLGQWEARRRRMSRLATAVSAFVTKVRLTDPMSGFFMIRCSSLHEFVRELSGVGFKILLDIFASSPRPLRFSEIPYEFRAREHGESKLDTKVILEFFQMLLDKTVGWYVPTRFVMFSLVGSLGLLFHMLTLAVLFRGFAISFQTAQIAATFTAMSSNFVINNLFTYYDRRLVGWNLLTGWLSFCAASSIGAVANVSVAVYLFKELSWPWVWSAISGVSVGAVWNFAITSFYTWKSEPAHVRSGR